jgi:hypothetical protein
MINNGSDIVVANDKKEMDEAKDHVAYFLTKNDIEKKVKGKRYISMELFEIIKQL